MWEVNLLPSFSDKVKNVWSFTPTTLHAFTVWHVINYEDKSNLNRRKNLQFSIQPISYIIQIWVIIWGYVTHTASHIKSVDNNKQPPFWICGQQA